MYVSILYLIPLVHILGNYCGKDINYYKIFKRTDSKRIENLQSYDLHPYQLSVQKPGKLHRSTQFS